MTIKTDLGYIDITNEVLAGISTDERNEIMDAVVLAQPLSE